MRASSHHIAFFARLGVAAAVTATLLGGCKSTPPPAKTTVGPAQPPAPTFSAATQPRPHTAPPTFRVFHSGGGSFTLVTKDNATDEEIAAILWQLRDAARTHTLAHLKIDQAEADKYSPAWFHVYRGTKCASEKYGSGKLPCGGGYHAAGDYTYGGPKNPNWDTGSLLHGEDAKETQLWNPDTPYVPGLSAMSLPPASPDWLHIPS